VLNVIKKKYPSQDLPYHIIVPSLPGYTLSSGPPLDKDFKVEDIARIIDKLMVGLGFGSGYIGQGGDIGSFTCRVLAQYPSCKGIHLNFNIMGKPDIPDSEVSALEERALERAKNFKERATGYSLEHGTRAATIGFALQSSPIALFAWISEKFITWTDVTPPLDEILDSVTLYWFTQTISRCLYPYRQLHGNRSTTINLQTDPKYYIQKPFGYSYFPMENSPIPVAWVKTTGNLVWSREHDRGGHFAALENPELFTKDIESFVKQIWKS
jgi:microsomal epoxide hydrolase